MKHILAILLFLLCLSSLSSAQDLMYLKNNKTPIKVKVYEIGLDEVKYRPWGDTVIPILVLPRLNISKLELANGSVFEFKDNPMTDAANYADQHNNAIKVSLLSPLFSHLALSYEHSIKPGRSFEVGLGIIGLGAAYDLNPKGLFGRVGYKFILAPDYYHRGMRYAHILKGGYIKPEVVFGSYAVDRYNYGYSYSYYYNYNTFRRNVTFGGVLVNFGKQWVIDDGFVCDIFVGMGYGFSAYEKANSGYYDNYEEEFYHYGFLGGIEDFPIALNAGIKLGFAFGSQKPKTKVAP